MSIAREHVMEDIDCWCQPTLMRLCPECGGEDSHGCWCCRGLRTVFIERGEARFVGEPLIIVHKDWQNSQAIIHNPFAKPRL